MNNMVVQDWYGVFPRRGCIVFESMWKSLVNFRPDKIGRLLTSMTIVSTHSVALEIGHSKATNVANSMFLLPFGLKSIGCRKIVTFKCAKEYALARESTEGDENFYFLLSQPVFEKGAELLLKVTIPIPSRKQVSTTAFRPCNVSACLSSIAFELQDCPDICLLEPEDIPGT